jgi:hypothetical protein
MTELLSTDPLLPFDAALARVRDAGRLSVAPMMDWTDFI